MIQTTNLTKKFGEKLAVSNLSLDIPRGEFFAFLGPNGAGKTTTIKMLTGLLRPTSGSISICGHDIETDYLHAKAKISYVPDQPYLYDKLSGREFLEFVGRMYRMGEDSYRKEIERLIDMFELGDYIDELCENYSHGMKQRVVLSSALLHNPEVLIIDEPMVGLDPKSARLVKDILRQRATNGTTVFMSTHTLDVAEEVAARIGIINEGKLIALGTLDEMRRIAQTDGRLEDAFLRITSDDERSCNSGNIEI